MIPLYHGTDLNSAYALLNGAPLSVELANKLKYPREKGLSQIGFYLTPQLAAAEMFAARRSGGVLQYNFTSRAFNRILSSGSVIQQIPPGRLPTSPGMELIVLPSAFPVFNSMRESGQITVISAP